MAFCESCGKPLRAGARFCGTCGAGVPQGEVGQAPVAQPSATAWSCASCTTANPADALFCSHCGTGRSAVPQAAPASEARTAVLPAPPIETAQPGVQGTELMQTTPPAEARLGAGQRSGVSNAVRKPWVIVFVAVVVFVAAAGVLVLALHRGNVEKAQASSAFAGQSHAIVTSLVPLTSSLRASLPASLAACAWSTSLSTSVRDADELQPMVAQAEDECAKLSSSTPSQTAVKQALSGALVALASYTQAISNLPAALSQVTTAQAQTVQNDAAAARDACQHLQTVDAQMQSLPVAACTTLTAGAGKARRDAGLRLFLVRVQNDILDQSQYGRQDIVNAINGVNGMTMNPSDAANQIQSVQSNRQSLLDQLSAMNVPDDARATALFSLLQQALQHSIEADRDFAAWMNDIYTYYWQDPVGYMGNVPHTADYNKAQSQSTLANAAKGSFCSRYDPLARRLGLKHTWQASEI
jgi:Double zinc ribbon